MSAVAVVVVWIVLAVAATIAIGLVFARGPGDCCPLCRGRGWLMLERDNTVVACHHCDGKGSL